MRISKTTERISVDEEDHGEDYCYLLQSATRRLVLGEELVKNLSENLQENSKGLPRRAKLTA
jgi:hypothetical protein